MSSQYVLILVLYAFAAFGAIATLTEAAIWFARRPLLKLISRLQPTDGVFAHVLLRALPVILALLLTSFSALPGYLNGEPIGTAESPGFALIALALLGMYAVVAPVVRLGAVWYRTHLRTLQWKRDFIGGEEFASFPVVEVASKTPLVVAEGVLKHRIFLSSVVRELLSPRELRAVLRHEVAHCRQHHNLVRLFCGVLPRVLGQDVFDDHLRETIEYVADDEACLVPGDALNLASAVVLLARESVSSPRMLYTGLLEETESAILERRVERLVVCCPRRGQSIFLKLATGSALLVTLTTSVGMLPMAQHAFRETLEFLVR